MKQKLEPSDRQKLIEEGMGRVYYHAFSILLHHIVFFIIFFILHQERI